MLRFQDVHRMKLEYAKHMAQQKGSWNKNKIQEPFNVWWKTCEPPSIIPCLRLTFGVGPYLSPWFCTCEDGGTNLCKERKRKGRRKEAEMRKKKRNRRGKERGKGIYLWSPANFSTNSLTKLSLWRGPPIRCTMCVVHFPNTKGQKHDLP